VLLPVIVAMDAFVISHTQVETELPDQALVDRYLPPLELPHRLDPRRPVTVGGLVWPAEAAAQRYDIDRAMARVPTVLEECRAEFTGIFERDPDGAVQPFEVEGAETVLVASGSIATTARETVRRRRAAGERVGLIKIKLYRPFPEEEIVRLCRGARRLGVLDRNYGAGMGGIFWQDLCAAFQGRRDDLVIQDYLTGLCGGDVTPAMIDEVLADLGERDRAGRPLWMGVEAAQEVH
jgi:pyruvate/2-oxoacid:ferredoxin oxidoreductase alpha subunit